MTSADRVEPTQQETILQQGRALRGALAKPGSAERLGVPESELPGATQATDPVAVTSADPVEPHEVRLVYVPECETCWKPVHLTDDEVWVHDD